MKIFVTVGNTQYNSLIKAIDETLSADEFEVTIQLADGSYTPKNHQFFRFTPNIETYFNDADVIITHAGAGTVFQLLEDNAKMVVIPNHERIDTHQLDLAQYVDNNHFASACYDLATIKAAVMSAAKNQYSEYVNDPFSGYELIADIFQTQTTNMVGTLPLNIFSDMNDAVDHVVTDLGDVIPGSAIAINPEKVIRAIDDSSIRDAIMSASIRYADGIGVVKTLARKSGEKVSRVPGCELWEAVMDRAGAFDIPVYLVGASNETITETANLLEKQYSVNICGIQDGYFDKDKEQDVIDRIAQIQPKIVTVALGSPRQEMFIQKCRKVCPNSFFMGVGGTYDVYTNKVKRAPLFYRKLNLEWFYRLMSQPKRLFRQTNLVKYLYLELTRQL
jgi:UDP-N-acetyl-D-mannosaminouronate:lipid I N-acetyl-D-mannosaminouronosyltransferase